MEKQQSIGATYISQKCQCIAYILAGETGMSHEVIMKTHLQSTSTNWTHFVAVSWRNTKPTKTVEVNYCDHVYADKAGYRETRTTSIVPVVPSNGFKSHCAPWLTKSILCTDHAFPQSAEVTVTGPHPPSTTRYFSVCPIGRLLLSIQVIVDGGPQFTQIPAGGPHAVDGTPR
ncbi:hypothetical protein T265_02466 [Opisthorchis viverrini]|uniref:Uncharacterized protein n=1 Tax=Opisthorchis viverrini TaxID=6198 RepID=A0A074ZUZ3_OPIVI|nr:hypothetical protein T265_02466 [Opisthorchis viverrini]KER31283.1 hypothetical protein T265_02466 [Opisthorchis viverrini]